MIWLDHLRQRLEAREAGGLFRTRQIVELDEGSRSITIAGKRYRNFGSNDYLGLSKHDDLIATWAEASQSRRIGSGGSPLVTGYRSSHAAFETEAAEFVGFSRALLFGSGFLANIALMTALLGPSDTVYVDRLAHASINEGIRLSGARLKRFCHNDTDHLRTLIDRDSTHRSVIVTEALFSMDGDCAPLTELLAIAEEIDALLIVDEAHSFGLYGPDGRGLSAAAGLSSDRLVLVAPLGKAAGAAGAFIAATEAVIETVIQFAKPYVYSTAMPPAMAETLRRALQLIAEADGARTRLQDHVVTFRGRLAKKLWPTTWDRSPIQPYLIGDDRQSVDIAKALADRGCWVPAIRPPTVPQGQARLRISLTAAHRDDDIACLCDALDELTATQNL